MKLLILLVAGALASSLTVAVEAHPKAYVAGNGLAYVSDCSDATSPTVGEVCFPAGHVSVGSVIEIHDDVNPATVGGVLCQDNCAVATPFCGSVVTTTQGEFVVFLDSPVFGMPIFNLCGSPSSAGVAGTVDHH